MTNADHAEELLEMASIDRTFLPYKIRLFKEMPFAELNAPLALDTVAYGDDNIEVIERNWFLYAINV